MLGPREVVEERGQLAREALDVHALRLVELTHQSFENQRDEVHREDRERERGQERPAVDERMCVGIKSQLAAG